MGAIRCRSCGGRRCGRPCGRGRKYPAPRGLDELAPGLRGHDHGLLRAVIVGQGDAVELVTLEEDVHGGEDVIGQASEQAVEEVLILGDVEQDLLHAGPSMALSQRSPTHMIVSWLAVSRHQLAMCSKR